MSTNATYKKALARMLRMDRDLHNRWRMPNPKRERLIAVMAAIGKGRVMQGRKDQAIAVMNAARAARKQEVIV